MLEASINKMEDKLYCPSEEELLTAMYRGRSWGDKAYVESQLRDAGFTNVDVKSPSIRMNMQQVY